MAIPKVLVKRDPRNRQHITAAMAICDQISGHTVLEGTVADLQAANIPLPPNTTVHKSIQNDHLVVGGFFLLESGLYYPDNVIRVCRDCRHPIQFRPALGHAPNVQLCVFCATDRLLKEYWSMRRSTRR